MNATIDRNGRLVVPKALRERAGLAAGMELEISLHEGYLEIAPAPRQVRLERRGRLVVARAVERDETLTQKIVDQTRDKLRRRHGES